jgi:hypothetical protein
MKRRLFLQLAGLSPVASILVDTVPDIVLPIPHYVISGGSYTGRIFDGRMFSRGINAGFVCNGMTRPQLDRDISFHPTTVEYLQYFKRFGPSDLALALSRTHHQMVQEVEEIKNSRLFNQNPFEHTSIVTVVRRTPRIAKDKQGKYVLDTEGHNHYLLQGEVHPRFLWASNGYIPLDVVYDNKSLQEWRDAQTRANITYVDDQGLDDNSDLRS